MSIRLAIVGLILIAALALGWIAFQVTRPAHPVVQATQSVTAPLMVNYLTAARALPVGTLARDEDFAVTAVLPDKVPAGALLDTPETRTSLRGAMLRHFLDPGTPVTANDVLRVRDRGFLSAVLEPGTRAVSVGVDEVSGVSGLIWPGDRVDVILTQDLDPATPVGRRVVSETVLEDARVIAIDQEIARARGDVPSAQGASRVPRSVTLQISPDDADKLAVAQRLGHLSLAVRAISDGPKMAMAPSSTFSKDVSPALSAPGGATVRVIQGDQNNDVTFR
jgi:pilus assembly protein CpaB